MSVVNSVVIHLQVIILQNVPDLSCVRTWYHHQAFTREVWSQWISSSCDIRATRWALQLHKSFKLTLLLHLDYCITLRRVLQLFHFVPVWLEKNKLSYKLQGLHNIGVERLRVLFSVLLSQAPLLTVVRILHCQMIMSYRSQVCTLTITSPRS